MKIYKCLGLEGVDWWGYGGVRVYVLAIYKWNYPWLQVNGKSRHSVDHIRWSKIPYEHVTHDVHEPQINLSLIQAFIDRHRFLTEHKKNVIFHRIVSYSLIQSYFYTHGVSPSPAIPFHSPVGSVLICFRHQVWL